MFKMVLGHSPLLWLHSHPPLRTPSKRSDCSETQRNVVDTREDKVGDREVVRDEEECQDCDKESDVDDEEAQEGERDEEYGQESDVDVAEDELEFRVDGLHDEEADTKIQTPLPDLVGGVEDKEIFRRNRGKTKP